MLVRVAVLAIMEKKRSRQMIRPTVTNATRNRMAKREGKASGCFGGFSISES
jgi:hypothetical protein